MNILNVTHKQLRMQYISAFCLEFSLILKAGISVNDGLMLLAEDEKNQNIKELLTEMHNGADLGVPLFTVMNKTGVFPKYLCDMIRIAEKTGRLEMTFFSLSEYYERRYRISKNIQTAVTYPLLLSILMLSVVFILITEVVPVFNDVSIQIGVQPSVIAKALVNFGEFISKFAVFLFAFIIMIFIAAYYIGKRLLQRGKLGFQIATVRFSASMEMIIKSGLNIEDSLEMVRYLTDNYQMSGCIDKCISNLAEGNSFPAATEKAGIYNSVFNRMLSIGFKTGSLDIIMSEITRRCEEILNDRIEKSVNLIEPILIIILSLLVGFIMLSVMLPLLNILTFIG